MKRRTKSIRKKKLTSAQIKKHNQTRKALYHDAVVEVPNADWKLFRELTAQQGMCPSPLIRKWIREWVAAAQQVASSEAVP